MNWCWIHERYHPYTCTVTVKTEAQAWDQLRALIRTLARGKQ